MSEPASLGRGLERSLSLTLFFTRGVSLATWAGAGILARELAIYRRLIARGVRVTFVTYGKRGERRYRSQLAGFDIRHNRWGLPEDLYAKGVSWLHGSNLAATSVVKSNQVLGADVALAAARRYGKPFVARCGYLHSDFMEYAHGKSSRQAKAAEALERTVFTGADRVVVTTQTMSETVAQRYGIDRARIRVLPNYVDTELFRPRTAESKRRVCFIGRLVEQKNLHDLLVAMSGLNVEVVIVGEGHLRSALETEARALGIAATFTGAVAHEDLPRILSTCTVFALPSRYEGHPKTLIEAMASGLPTVGVDSPGTRDVIRHGETGLLCKPGDLRDAIATLLDDQALQARLGAAARRLVEEQFALDRLVEVEYALLYELVCRAVH